MEHLDILEKIYLYGETLSSEEMNLIVSRLNIIINSVNTIIRNNNGISAGHCEMRYILSPLQPIKPETGTDGLSNGWSNLYLLPEIGSGNSTWMSLCFVSGEDTYGEWSAPVCIYSGTMSGQLGPKGDSGETGAFVSRVFKRQNTKPDTPVGGTYNYPIPDGWFDGVPEGLAIIWSSTATFYGNGTQTDWSEPAQESDTDTLDIEFSPSATQPPAPLGNTPYSNHEAEGWFDPNSPNFNSAGIMIWRAERKVSNGEYNGDWTITRIFGEKGENGLKGDTGGHYEFRYNNFKATEDLPTPIKPADGSDGTANGWKRNQEALTELEIKEGMFTWMTLSYLDENGVYQPWSEPIRITGANGIDGEDGTEQEFMYTRNNTGEFPPTPPTTQKNEAALFNDFGEWTDPDSGIVWTDDPQGVNDEMMWEFVTTRVKEGTIWGPFSTPVIWAKWGKQGRIGQMSYLAGVWNASTEYIKTAERNPIVYHVNRDHTSDYYYLIGELTFEGPNKHITEITSIGLNPEDYPGVWAKAEHYEMVFTDILFVLEFAKLLSFIINHDWMLSQHGTLYDANGGGHDIDDNSNWSGHTVNDAYTYFDPRYPNSNEPGDLNFVPAFAIDALSGRSFFLKGYFKGAIVADSLHLGDNVTISQLKVNNLVGDLLAKLGKSVGGNFNVNDGGILTAHNAFIDGTIIARSGSFVGDVHATEFIAGNQSGLNITTSGSAISFNYGEEQRAWFTPYDSDGNDTGGLFLYIKEPSNPSNIITIDFANLLFKNANISGSAVLSKKIFRDITDENFLSSVFIDSTTGKYYNDPGLSSSHLYTVSNYYELMDDTSYCIVAQDGANVMYKARWFNKVSFSSGDKTVVDSNYWVSAKIGNTRVSLRGSNSAGTFRDYNTGLEDAGSLISNNPNLEFNSNDSYYYGLTGTGTGGYLTKVLFINRPNGATLAAGPVMTMHTS